MGKLIVMNQVTVNGAFEAPSPDDWLVLDEDSSEASLEQLILAEALVLGRKTYEGTAASRPHRDDWGARTLADAPGFGRRILVLDQPVHLGGGPEDLRRCGGRPPRARRVDPVPIGRRVAALPPRGRLIDAARRAS
jgi:hypothetical protein